MKGNSKKFIDPEQNRGVLNRIKQHYNVKTDKEVMIKWGKHEKSMNNWRNTGIPVSELSLLAEDEDLNFEWLLHGTGEKDKIVMPISPLKGIIDVESNYTKLARALDKIPKEKQDIACSKALIALAKYQ